MGLSDDGDEEVFALKGLSESSDEELMSSGDEAPKPAAKPAMSRFLRSAGDDSSSDDSSSDSEEESEMSDDEPKEEKKKSRFLRTMSDDDDSEEDERRVVKSAKDKRLDEMEACGKTMDNALKINDWVAISNGLSLHPYLCARLIVQFLPLPTLRI